VLPIIIFDSGIGGLSIFDEVRQVLPNHPIIYCSDNAEFPYGIKAASDIRERVSLCLRSVVDRFNPQLVIIACNTASTVTLPRIRKELSIPVVGVVPAVKMAADSFRNSDFGVLATRGTAKRRYVHRLIKQHASHCNVLCVGSSRLAVMAEQLLRGNKVDHSIIKEILNPFIQSNINNIVLGCTHFSLLKKELSYCQPTFEWIDAGKAIARRVEMLITIPATFDLKPQTALFTQIDKNTLKLLPAFNSRGFTKIRELQL